MKENYIYPAMWEEDEEGSVSIWFPDFPDIMTCADSQDGTEIIRAAQELLAITIMDYEAENRILPKPTEGLEDAVDIHIWMPYFRSITKEVYVKKTVTVPQWLDTLARKQNINFSAALVRGIKKEAGENQ